MLKWDLPNVFRLLFIIVLIGVLLISFIYAAPSSAATYAHQALNDESRRDMTALFRTQCDIKLRLAK